MRLHKLGTHGLETRAKYLASFYNYELTSLVLVNTQSNNCRKLHDKLRMFL